MRFEQTIPAGDYRTTPYWAEYVVQFPERYVLDAVLIALDGNASAAKVGYYVLEAGLTSPPADSVLARAEFWYDDTVLAEVAPEPSINSIEETYRTVRTGYSIYLFVKTVNNDASVSGWADAYFRGA